MTGYLMKLSLFILGFWVPVLLAESLPAGAGKAVEVIRDSQPGSVKEPELQDPTLMTQSFRDALTRMAQTQAKGAVNRSVVAQSELPEIKLSASLLGDNSGIKSFALVKIGDKTYSAHENDIIIAYDNAKEKLDVELQVIEIHQYFVKIMLISPINKTLILR